MTRDNFWMLLLAVFCIAASCAWRDNARTLDAYREESERCSQNIEAIVAREGTTREQDLADLDAEETRCFDTLEQIMGGAE
jgi:hypothetical protein